jgi:hypothetical protein
LPAPQTHARAVPGEIDWSKLSPRGLEIVRQVVLHLAAGYDYEQVAPMLEQHREESATRKRRLPFASKRTGLSAPSPTRWSSYRRLMPRISAASRGRRSRRSSSVSVAISPLVSTRIAVDARR